MSSAFSTHCVFFLGEELKLELFYYCVLSVVWFWKPFSILFGNKKQPPLAVLLFFSVVHAPPARLLAVRCTPMTPPNGTRTDICVLCALQHL